MTEEYTKIYCESMAKSLEDKLFFLNEIDINDYDYIVDFGCADGRILEVLDERLTNKKTILIGIENNKVMFDQLVSLAGRAKHRMIVSIELIDGDNEIFNLLKRGGKKSLIIFSSVLHEYDWENFKPFFILFDTIVMRDMQSPEKFWYKVSESTRALVTKDFPGELLAKLERKYGYINDLERLYKYFLMYRYADNFDHELQEDYFSIIWENLKEWLTNDYVFHILYEKDYILPFIKQDIETKFGYELKYPTHKQIIFVKD